MKMWQELYRAPVFFYSLTVARFFLGKFFFAIYHRYFLAAFFNRQSYIPCKIRKRERVAISPLGSDWGTFYKILYAPKSFFGINAGFISFMPRGKSGKVGFIKILVYDKLFENRV